MTMSVKTTATAASDAATTMTPGNQLTITLTHIGKWRQQEFSFPMQGCSLIAGRSGSGKTTILRAFMFAFFDTGRYLVTHDQKMGRVTVDFPWRGRHIRIMRQRGPKKVVYECVGDPAVEGEEADARIAEIVRAPGLFYSDQGYGRNFLNLSGADQLATLQTVLQSVSSTEHAHYRRKLTWCITESRDAIGRCEEQAQVYTKMRSGIRVPPESPPAAWLFGPPTPSSSTVASIDTQLHFLQKCEVWVRERGQLVEAVRHQERELTSLDSQLVGPDIVAQWEKDREERRRIQAQQPEIALAKRLIANRKRRARFEASVESMLESLDALQTEIDECAAELQRSVPAGMDLASISDRGDDALRRLLELQAAQKRHAEKFNAISETLLAAATQLRDTLGVEIMVVGDRERREDNEGGGAEDERVFKTEGRLPALVDHLEHVRTTIEGFLRNRVYKCPACATLLMIRVTELVRVISSPFSREKQSKREGTKHDLTSPPSSSPPSSSPPSPSPSVLANFSDPELVEMQVQLKQWIRLAHERDALQRKMTQLLAQIPDNVAHLDVVALVQTRARWLDLKTKYRELDERRQRVMQLDQEFAEMVATEGGNESRWAALTARSMIRDAVPTYTRSLDDIPDPTPQLDRQTQLRYRRDAANQQLSVMRARIETWDQQNRDEFWETYAVAAAEVVTTAPPTIDVRAWVYSPEFHFAVARDALVCARERIRAQELIRGYNDHLEVVERERKAAEAKYHRALRLETLSQRAEMMQLEMVVRQMNRALEEILPVFFSGGESGRGEITAFLRTTKETRGGKCVRNILSTQVYQDGCEVALASLSGGEQDRLRLAFTIALSHVSQSPFLFLDECVSSLDKETSGNVFECLLERSKTSGQCILLIAHQVVVGGFTSFLSLDDSLSSSSLEV